MANIPNPEGLATCAGGEVVTAGADGHSKIFAVNFSKLNGLGLLLAGIPKTKLSTLTSGGDVVSCRWDKFGNDDLVRVGKGSREFTIR